MHDGGDAHSGLDRLAADAVLAQHLLVRLDAHAAAVHRRNGERPELEIGLLDAGLGSAFMRRRAGIVR